MSNKGKKGFVLATDNWVSKSNVLNEIRNNRMTISQIRFFTIYLSKINPKDINSRVVTFKLDDYLKIMQIKQVNTTRLQKSAKGLLDIKVTIWDKKGQYSSDGLKGFIMCHMFNYFRFYKSNEGEWLVTIDCHNDIVKLMFDLRKHYFKYQLWNALQLTSVNQQRMYEILKQYEYAGIREVSIKDLREYLGLKPEEYKEWQNFKIRVLNAAQEAMANYTDIKFTWEVAGKRGKGGKINYIKFNIEKNSGYVRQLTLDEYITEQETAEIIDETDGFVMPDEEDRAMPHMYGDADDGNEIGFFEREIYSLLKDACEGEFNLAEIQVLYNLIVKIVPRSGARDYLLDAYDYLKRKYDELIWRAQRAEIKSRFGYIKKLVEVDLE